MKKITNIFSIFLLSLTFVGPNKLSPFAFTDATSFTKASENEEVVESRDTSNDINSEPEAYIDELVLGEQISGELSYLNPYSYYKFTNFWLIHFFLLVRISYYNDVEFYTYRWLIFKFY